MLCTGRILAASNWRTLRLPHSVTTTSPFKLSGRYSPGKLKPNLKWRCTASASSDSDASSYTLSIDFEPSSAGFCIIEDPKMVQDFAKMELREIQDNIQSRWNKIFLQMEEVRRLRIQQRIKSAELGILKEEQRRKKKGRRMMVVEVEEGADSAAEN